MFRQLATKFLKTLEMQYQTKNGHQNQVMNDTLATFEKQCDPSCFVPRRPPQKVTVLGAGTDVGRISCLFLKQQKIIRILAMYDEPERNVFGAANDIAHIDTSPAVQAFQGKKFLKDALDDADVVLICGGSYILPTCCNTLDRDLFFENMSFVRTSAIAAAQFAPVAIVAVQTPPVDANFALVKYTLKQAKGKEYDKRKVLGLNAVNAMRANQLFSVAVGRDPTSSNIPVVCGTGRCTRVPCFSGAKEASKISSKQISCLTRLVREADDMICKVKSNNEQGHLSLGFSSARFVTNLMKGLFGSGAYIDSALVDQGSPSNCYNMKTCATPVQVGKGGITQYLVPKLNNYETNLLEQSKCDLQDSLNLGKCYALGDEYYLHPQKVPSCVVPPHCPVVTPC